MQATREVPSGLAPDDGAGAMRSRRPSSLRPRHPLDLVAARLRRRFVVVLTVALIAAGFALDLAVPGYAIAGFYWCRSSWRCSRSRDGTRPWSACSCWRSRSSSWSSRTAWTPRTSCWCGSPRSPAPGCSRSPTCTTGSTSCTSPSDARPHDCTSSPPSCAPSRRPRSSSRLRGRRRSSHGSPRRPASSSEASLHVYPSAWRDRTRSYLEPRRPRPGQASAAAGRRAAAAQAVDRRSAVLEGAHLAVPLFVRDDVYGAVVLSDRDGRVLPRRGRRIAQTFGDQAALAVENARLRERVERAAVAAERMRLARELHDSVTQSLFAASLEADVVAETCRRRSRRWPRHSTTCEAHPRRARGDAHMLLEMRPDGLVQSPARRAAQAPRRGRAKPSAHHRRPQRRQPERCRRTSTSPSTAWPRRP